MLFSGEGGGGERARVHSRDDGHVPEALNPLGERARGVVVAAAAAAEVYTGQKVSSDWETASNSPDAGSPSVATDTRLDAGSDMHIYRTTMMVWGIFFLRDGQERDQRISLMNGDVSGWMETIIDELPVACRDNSSVYTFDFWWCKRWVLVYICIVSFTVAPLNNCKISFIFCKQV